MAGLGLKGGAPRCIVERSDCVHTDVAEQLLVRMATHARPSAASRFTEMGSRAAKWRPKEPRKPTRDGAVAKRFGKMLRMSRVR